MNMLVKKRQLITAALIVALGAAVFVNWYFTRSGSDISQPTEKNPDSEFVQNLGEAKSVNATIAPETSQSYFDEVKLERTKAHDKAVADIKAALKEAPEGENKKAAAAAVEKLGSAIKLEADIEALIKAKLGCEAVVVLTDTNAQVVTEKGKLTEDAVLIITDIITANTALKPENIKITEAK